MVKSFLNYNLICSYEKLVKNYPEVAEYKMLYAQTLYKSGNYTDSQRLSLGMEDPQHALRVRTVNVFPNCEDVETAKLYNV
jgi:hypothetical protein